MYVWLARTARAQQPPAPAKPAPPQPSAMQTEPQETPKQSSPALTQNEKQLSRGEERRHAHCCQQVAKALLPADQGGDLLVNTLLNSIERRGCALPGDFFRCVRCNDEQLGVISSPDGGKESGKDEKAKDGPTRAGTSTGASFDPREGVSICEDRVAHAGAARSALVHELVHTFDYCRAKIDFDNPEHVACTEIRASNLSKECGFARELFTRAQFGIRKHHQECVRRRAILSVTQHFGEDEAKRAVDRVWQRCFYDFAPFDEIP